MKLQYKLSNGSYIDCPDDYIDEMIVAAVKTDQKFPDTYPKKLRLQTADDAIQALEAGHELRHGTDWYDWIRDGEAYERKIAALEVRRNADLNYSNEGWELDCGCIVYHRSHIMNASLGTACTDCYDRMSN